MVQPVTLKGINKDIEVRAKLDSGAFRTSIDIHLAKDLDLVNSTKKVPVTSASGESLRPVVNLTFEIGGKKITTQASIADRSKLRYPMIVGRRDLHGFLIDPKVAPEDEEKDLPR